MTAAWWETWGNPAPGAASFWVASHVYVALASRFGQHEAGNLALRALDAGNLETAELYEAKRITARHKVDTALRAIGWTCDAIEGEAGLFARRCGVDHEAPTARAWLIAHREEHRAAGQAIADAWEARTP